MDKKLELVIKSCSDCPFHVIQFDVSYCPESNMTHYHNFKRDPNYIFRLSLPDDVPKPLAEGWIRTDDFQFVLKRAEKEFSVIEIACIPDGTFSCDVHEIDLDYYTDDEILSYITGFYNSLFDITAGYGLDSNQIIAECISESQGFDEDTKTFNSLVEVNVWLAEIDISLVVGQ